MKKSPTAIIVPLEVKMQNSNSDSKLTMLGRDAGALLFVNLLLVFINIYPAAVVVAENGDEFDRCSSCNRPELIAKSASSVERYEEIPIVNGGHNEQRLLHSAAPAAAALSPFSDPSIYETFNNRSIYSSLTKIIYQLKNQLQARGQHLSGRSDNDSGAAIQSEPAANKSSSESSAAPSQSQQQQRVVAAADRDTSNKPADKQNSPTLDDTSRRVVSQTNDRADQNDNQTATITFEIIGEPIAGAQQEGQSPKLASHDPNSRRADEQPAMLAAQSRRNGQQKLTPVSGGAGQQGRPQVVVTQSDHLQRAHRPPSAGPNKIVLSRWQPANAQSLARPFGSEKKKAERSSRNNKKLEEPDGGARDLATGLMDQLMSDDDVRYRGAAARSGQAAQPAGVKSWSRPLTVLPLGTVLVGKTTKQTTLVDEGRDAPELAAPLAYNQHIDKSPAHLSDDMRALRLIEASSLGGGGDYLASGSDQPAPQQPDDEEQAPVANGQPLDRARLPALSPQSIRLQQVYPRPAAKSTRPEYTSVAEQHQPQQPAPNYGGERDEPLYSRDVGVRRLVPNGSALLNHLQSHSLEQGASSYQAAAQQRQPLVAPAAQAQLQRPPFQMGQQQSFPRDLLDQPQTIQITAIPNNNVLANGILGGGVGGQVVRINTDPGLTGLWGNRYLDPFGRPVMMVNAERRQLDWSFWIWPLIAIVTLPLIMGALFVPIFLKTIVIIIQILQSLGLLLPIANALGSQIATVTGNSMAASTLSALAAGNQLTAAEHHQKDAPIEVRNVTATTMASTLMTN
jgi:hypothetical protein